MQRAKERWPCLQHGVRCALAREHVAVYLHGLAGRIDFIGTMCGMSRLEGGVGALEPDAASLYSSGGRRPDNDNDDNKWTVRMEDIQR